MIVKLMHCRVQEDKSRPGTGIDQQHQSGILIIESDEGNPMKNSDKRRASRIVENLDAEIVTGGKTYKGIVMNFSEAGLHMVTATASSAVDITPLTLIELRCKLLSGKQINLKCEVKWFQTKMSTHGVSFSLGMEILKPPKEYVTFVEAMV